jgi:ribose 1,5-bisphosphokinase
VVTRQASQAEDNDELSLDAFRQALARGEFAMHWEAHGHCYALPRAIEDDIRAGRTVVINVSRTVVDAVRRAYADVVVVSITAPPDILAERLEMRARGSDGRIKERLSRAVDDAAAAPDVTIINVGDAAGHAGRLVKVIKDGEAA